MTSRSSILTAALFLAACGSDSAPTDSSPSATPPASATTTTTSKEKAPEEAPALEAAKAKAFKSTGQQDLGTLPEGVGIAVGETAPDFELPAVEGGEVSLSELTEKSEVMLVFYRGGW